MNLSAMDLNLFLVLHAMLETGSTTAAARRLHVTQSAVSNALARLRKQLGDPLFVRDGRGLTATPTCLELAPHVAVAVTQLESVVSRERVFDPLTSTRGFTLACSDDLATCEVPRLAAAFGAELPHTPLRVVSIDQLIAARGLAHGPIDAAVLPRQAVAPGDHATSLYTDPIVVVARRGHPTVKQRITRKAFNEVRLIQPDVSGGGDSIVMRHTSRVMAEHGLALHVRVRVGSFSLAAMTAAKTDLITAMPRRVAELFCELLPLRMVASPFDAIELDMVLTWHARTDAEPAARFARSLIERVIGKRRARAKP